MLQGPQRQAANTKIPAVASDIESSEAELTQTKADLKAAQVSRSDAKAAMAEATSIRDKEASTYAQVKSDAESNIGALYKAIPVASGPAPRPLPAEYPSACWARAVVTLTIAPS